MTGPTPRLGRPRSLRDVAAGRAPGQVPEVPAVGGPIRVGPWQTVGPPIELPGSGSIGGGTRPIFEGFGPPPAVIEGAIVDDYYLDKISGDLYRLGG